MLSAHLQVFNAEFFLIDVRGVSPSSQTSHGSQVAAVSTHSLNDEDTALGSRCRLLDSVAGLQKMTWKKWTELFFIMCVYFLLRHLQR